MGHYNGIAGFRTLGFFVLLSAIAGCANQPQQESTYSVSVPADTSQNTTTTTAAASDSTMVDPTPVRVREDVPLRYVVKKGDTLWGIANHFLRDSWQWPEIWYVNDKIRNPHLIYPGDVLTLVYKEGKPRLVANVETEVSAYSGDVVKLSPQARPGDLERAIPAIPIEAIRDFLNSSRLVTPEEMKSAPYLLSFLDPQVVGGADAEVYVKGYKPGNPTTFAVVRSGEVYKDPDTGEILGYEAIPVGTAEVTDTRHELVTVRLLRTVREARPGDRLLPLEQETFDAYFYPKAPKNKIDASIISVLDGVSQITQYQVVTLNRGANAGLERGDILSVLQAGRKARDPDSPMLFDRQVTLPDLEAGTMMIFKVAPKVSYGLIMRSTRAIHRLDKVQNPTQR